MDAKAENAAGQNAGPAGVPAANGTPKRSKLPKIAAALVFIAAAAYGINHYVWGLTHEDTDDAFLEGRVIPISARAAGHVLRVNVSDNQEVKAGDLLVEIDPRDFELGLEKARAALLNAHARAEAAAKTVGFTDASSGSGVKTAEAAVERAAAAETVKAGLKASEARVELSVAQTSAAVSAATQAAAQVEASASDLAFLEAEKKRYADLFKKEIVSAQQAEQAETAAKSGAQRLNALKSAAKAADAQVEAAKAGEKTARESLEQVKFQYKEALTSVDQAKSALSQAKAVTLQVGVTRAQSDALAKEIEMAEASVRQAELQLSYTRVLAPESGRITKKSVEPGSFIQVGQSLFAIVPKDLWVVANFKETQVSKMKPGQPVDITIDAFPDRKLTGRIESLQAGTGSRFSLLPPENATGNYVKVVQRLPVKIAFDKPLPGDLQVGPGMSVTPIVEIK